MLKPKKGFVQDQLNIERFSPIQWDGIMRAMDAYAHHYHEEQIVKDLNTRIEEAVAKYWYDTEYSLINKHERSRSEASRKALQEWMQENLSLFCKPDYLSKTE